ncbi:hypothetical protein BLNAU_18868 [Blattamonas nauphoetae]|uniref:Uncharacterized protein n=1 Tax=Blattamonas nauphoetae TaxID=2049346 RepID=A0ABQ9X3D1_9EUKA|nr:hypothetical protein BLNAU_18868 [Blattamonas nauphoetae]
MTKFPLDANCSVSSTTLPSSRSPSPLLRTPQLIFSDPTHFDVTNTVLLDEVFTSGILSFSITVHTVRNEQGYGNVFFGAVDSNSPFPQLRQKLGWTVDHSVGYDTYYGDLMVKLPTRRTYKLCHTTMTGGDSIRMELDLDSHPRNVRFFVNGEAGRCYVTGVPESVRIGFSVCVRNTMLRIDRISRLKQPTPFVGEMWEITWGE